MSDDLREQLNTDLGEQAVEGQVAEPSGAQGVEAGGQTALPSRFALDYFKKSVEGFDDSGFESDEQFLPKLHESVSGWFQQASQAERLHQENAILQRQLAEFQRQQQAAAQPAKTEAQKQLEWAWKGKISSPEDFELMQSLLDENGNPRPGADPQLKQKMAMEFRNTRAMLHALSNDPEGTINPLLEHYFQNKVQQQVQEMLEKKFQDWEGHYQTNRWIDINRDALWDQSNQPTDYHNAFFQKQQQLLAAGRPVEESIREASEWAAMQVELMQLRAKQAASPPPVSQQAVEKRAETQRANNRTVNRNGTVPRSSQDPPGDMSLRQLLEADLA